jgi:hypothetical protein
MKTLRVSDDVHQKLTALLGELMAQTSKMQTYQDAIEAMLHQSVILPPELLREVEEFVEKIGIRATPAERSLYAKPYASSYGGSLKNTSTLKFQGRNMKNSKRLLGRWVCPTQRLGISSRTK